MDDRHWVSAPAGSYRPNPWGLCDVHGNAAEWTRSEYPPTGSGRSFIRGGSWYDRPKDARSASRAAYPSWRKVYDVGFRVICE